MLQLGQLEDIPFSTPFLPMKLTRTREAKALAHICFANKNTRDPFALLILALDSLSSSLHLLQFSGILYSFSTCPVWVWNMTLCSQKHGLYDDMEKALWATWLPGSSKVWNSYLKGVLKAAAGLFPFFFFFQCKIVSLSNVHLLYRH